MANLENEENHIIDYELLALFDDTSALSHLENCSFDESYFGYNFYDEPRNTKINDIRLSRIDDSWKDKMNDRPIYLKNGQDEKENVFAVPKVYTCMYCFKGFYSRSANRRHQVFHAKKQLRCPYCRTTSHSMSNLRRHFDYFHRGAPRHQILIESP
ncbi:uncharacterized protein LOC128890593 [Hylaeus anthracinus]|uniref:uncharacterized protein LOC128890593 n=1 Tax=Hylaeus anthracinus TaxID=313031 RepID=UPI0023B9DF0D|nr:uncharacterized protein LOC128890593 [Hylaeus anthracinus]